MNSHEKETFKADLIQKKDLGIFVLYTEKLKFHFNWKLKILFLFQKERFIMMLRMLWFFFKLLRIWKVTDKSLDICFRVSF